MTESAESLPQFRRVLVEDATGLHFLLPELNRQQVLGIDLEMGQRVIRKPGGVQEWTHTLALIQIAAGDLSVVIDPLRCPTDSLAPLMSGPARKVFLGGGQDAALLDKAGIPAINIADVGEVAYALYGRREDGMAALAMRIFGISLDKTVRRTDWLLRPLNPTLLAYAHRDAELTLGIYHWFQREHPEVLRMHERPVLDESLPSTAPPWLLQAVSRSSVDAVGVVMAHDLSPATDVEVLADAIRPYLARETAPRLLNRLVRVAGDLHCVPLLPYIEGLVTSRSSLLRASAARAIGQLGEGEKGEASLRQLLEDPVLDVRRSAEGGLRELRRPSRPIEAEVEEEQPSIGGDALSALEALKAQLQEAE
ncbi:MAG: hypothetical protein ACRDFX_03095 [Chloroflexota bacterium]